MTYEETPRTFSCGDSSLLGIVSRPVQSSDIGVVIVVGGPQYRVGSHRQFTLLARTLAENGFTSFRFDYRGMGDSEGPRTGFADTASDIRAAVDAMLRHEPAVRRIVLWGLCDGATAIALMAGDDSRVAGLVLVNPWVRTESGQAKATLKHYYSRRVFDRAFWRGVVSGKVNISDSGRGLLRTIARASGIGRADEGASSADVQDLLSERVARGLSQHSGPALVILSENDLTAAEFRDASRHVGALERAMRRSDISCVEVAGADHTFSDADARRRVEQITLQWLRNNFVRRADTAVA